VAEQTARRLNVLVVGDDHNTVVNLGILLRSEGINVRLATGAEEVPAATTDFSPDVVLLDVPKPASARAVAQALMQSCGPRVPLLHHVAKPIDPDAILKVVLSITPT
jgi:two-component system, OmpR family, response regulator